MNVPCCEACSTSNCVRGLKSPNMQCNFNELTSLVHVIGESNELDFDPRFIFKLYLHACKTWSYNVMSDQGSE